MSKRIFATLAAAGIAVALTAGTASAGGYYKPKPKSLAVAYAANVSSQLIKAKAHHKNKIKALNFGQANAIAVVKGKCGCGGTAIAKAKNLSVQEIRAYSHHGNRIKAVNFGQANAIAVVGGGGGGGHNGGHGS